MGRLVSINTFNNGSTGRVMRERTIEARKNGWDAYCAYGRYNPGEVDTRFDIIIGNKWDVYFHYAYAKITNKRSLGLASRKATVRFVEKLDQLKPDLVQLHNLHGYYINIEVLFDYLKRSKVAVEWTLHDCWAFTGHCGYFTMAQCDKWKTQCHDCPQTHTMGSKGFFDSSKYNYVRKKEIISSLPVEQLSFVTPSRWLADLLGQSFLSEYSVTVRHNNVDDSVFKPTQSQFKTNNGIEGKRVLLGVASPWSERKGLHVFKYLDSHLDDSFSIVLVGLSDKQKRDFSDRTIRIGRTESAKELAEIYTMADLFVNPTYEDNYPSVNIESIACGTPVMTFDTGGSPECSSNPELCIVVNDKTPMGMEEAIASFFCNKSSK